MFSLSFRFSRAAADGNSLHLPNSASLLKTISFSSPFSQSVPDNLHHHHQCLWTVLLPLTADIYNFNVESKHQRLITHFTHLSLLLELTYMTTS